MIWKLLFAGWGEVSSRESWGRWGFLAPLVDWLWKPVLGLGTKDLDQGLGFHLECGICLMFQSDFTEAGSVGQGGGTGGWGSPHPVSGPGGGALEPKGVAGSATLQMTAGAQLRQVGSRRQAAL